jgi:NADH dehydrogenase (ubiquinone) flavoprotein 1
MKRGMVLQKNNVMQQAGMLSAFNKIFHGNLSDQDRIFTNVYKDGDPFIEGAMKRGDWN